MTDINTQHTQNSTYIKIITALLILMLLPVFLYAFTIQDVSVEEQGDFILEPAKIEVELSAGESMTKSIVITNRTGETRTFNIEIEDFTGSQDPSRTVVLLGNKEGPYTLRDYLKPEVREFVIKSKQKIILPVTITAPFDAEPGGRYGSILVSSYSPGNIEEGASGTKVISRLGALFFVRVSGDVNEEGALEDFRIGGDKRFFGDKGPDSFELLFRNDGSVHLNPYGFIRVTNIAGVSVDEIEVEPYFALPDSLRFREIAWSKELLLGRYKATAFINRGYDDIVDEQSLIFWVIPWKIVVSTLVIIVLIALIVKWFFSRFEFKKKI